MIDIPFVAKRPPGKEPWVEFGSDQKDFERWVPHICSIACIRSLILAIFGYAPTLWQLTKEAIDEGAFIVRADGNIEGAFHYPIVRILKRYGIEAFVFGRLAPEDLWSRSRDGVLIVSIDLRKLSSDLDGSHLVLMIGTASDRAIIHDNACVIDARGDACGVDRRVFELICNGRGIFVPWKGLTDRRHVYLSDNV